MTQPATGTTWKAGGFNDVDNRFLERGSLIAALVRDARGSATDISPHNPNGTVRWSPFAQDGKLRGDLFAFKRVNGVWTPNPETNEGFHLFGAFHEDDGPTTKPKIDTDDYMIEQSNWPFDVIMTKQDEPFSIMGAETAKPFLRRLRNNLPLSDADGNLLAETPGAANTGFGQLVEADQIDRQVLLLREFRKGGKVLQTVKGYALVKLVDIGDAKMAKKDAESAELTFKPLPDSYFMAMQDGEYVPVVKYEWFGGTLFADGTPSTFTVTLGAPSAGTFTLTFGGNTTDTIAYNAAATAVKSALVALDDGYKTSDWTVTGSNGGPYTVTTPGGALTGSGAGLTGGTFSVAAA